jgi:hypothetical protein
VFLSSSWEKKSTPVHALQRISKRPEKKGLLHWHFSTPGVKYHSPDPRAVVFETPGHLTPDTSGLHREYGFKKEGVIQVPLIITRNSPLLLTLLPEEG